MTSNNPSDAFLPCPFCEGQGFLEPPALGCDWHVYCDDCGASGADKNSASEAVSAWNTRAPMTFAREQPVGDEGLVERRLNLGAKQLREVLDYGEDDATALYSALETMGLIDTLAASPTQCARMPVDGNGDGL